MKKRLLINIYSIIVLVIMIFTLIQIVKLGILPNKYFYPIVIGDILFYSIGLLFYNLKKNALVILGIIILLFSAVTNCIGLYYISKVNSYISKSFNSPTYTIENKYYVVANANDVDKIEDISKDANIRYYKYSKSVDKATKDLGKYNYISSDSVFDSFLKVLYEKDNYLLISKADFDYFFSSTTLLNSSDFKVIYEFTVIEKVKVNNKTKDSYNIYINGLDFTGIMRDYNLIVTVNTKTHKILLTSIPRDYYIDVPAYNMKDTLMCLGSLDSEVSKEALEKLFNIEIDYTINVNTNSLVKIVDTLGGIEFCSDYDFITNHPLVLDTYDDTTGEKLHVIKGCKTYNGIETLAIARERVALPGRDRYRQKNCAQIIISIGKKLASTNSILNYKEIMDSFDGLYTTDMNEKVIKSLIKSYVDDRNYDIIQQSVDGTDGIGVGHLGTQEAWIMNPDMNTVDSASKKINEVLNEK